MRDAPSKRRPDASVEPARLRVREFVFFHAGTTLEPKDAPLGERPLSAKGVSAFDHLVARAAPRQQWSDHPWLEATATCRRTPADGPSANKVASRPTSATLTETVRAGETDRSSKPPPRQQAGQSAGNRSPVLARTAMLAVLVNRRDRVQEPLVREPPVAAPPQDRNLDTGPAAAPSFPPPPGPLERHWHWQENKARTLSRMGVILREENY